MSLLLLFVPSAIAYTNTPTDTSGAVDSFSIARGTVAVDVSGLVDSFSIARGTANEDTSGLVDSFSIARGTVNEDTSGLVDSFSITRGTVAVDSSGTVDSALVDKVLTLANTDNSVPTDITSISLSVSSAVSDTAGVVDTSSLSISLAPIDATGTTDSITIDASHTIVQVDSSGLTDPATVERPIASADNVTVTDSAWRDPGSLDNSGLTDLVSFSISTIILDLSVPTDAPALLRSAVATDLAGPTDVALSVDTLGPLDTCGVTDSLTWGWGSSPVEPSGLTDSATFVLGHGVVTTDDAGVVDSRRYDLSASISDLSGATDPLAFSQNLVILDSSGTSDVNTGAGSTQYVQTPTDSAGVIDTPGLALALSSAVESAGLTDPTVVTPGRQVAGQDVTTTTDLISMGPGLVREDSAGVTDPVRFTWNLGPVEPVTVVEQQIWDRAHFYSDVSVPSDIQVVSQGFGINPVDIAGTGGWDPTVIGKTWALFATDDAGVVEYFPFLSRGLATAEATGLVDSWIAAPGREEPAGVTDLVTLALGEVDQDPAGLTDVVSVAMNGGLFTQDVSGVSDSIALTRGLAASDVSVPTDPGPVVLRFNDQRATDSSGLVDPVRFDQTSTLLDFPIEQDFASLSRGLVASPESVTLGDVVTFDGSKVSTDPCGTSDLVSLGRQPAVADVVGVSDPAVIVLSVAYLDTNRVDTTDQVVVSLAIKITVLDSSGVSDFPGVANGVLRLVTVEGELAPQTRILALLASQDRLSAILGLPVPIVAQMAAQGRIGVVLADPPRIVVHLEAQP